MNKILKIIIEALPILLMVALIPLIKNDYLLSGIYIIIIALSFFIKYEKLDFAVLIFGFFIMIACEYIFLLAKVETFNRNTLFGMMPIWLPFLWGRGFVAIKRSLRILEKRKK